MGMVPCWPISGWDSLQVSRKEQQGRWARRARVLHTQVWRTRSVHLPVLHWELNQENDNIGTQVL